jgi:peptidyl-prolyl cis-trans isomerase NIMA-interacting 1
LKVIKYHNKVTDSLAIKMNDLSSGGHDSITTVSVEETLLEDAAEAVRLLQSGNPSISATDQKQRIPKPPDPLPMHWVLRESRSQPGYYYYFNHETGISSWEPPPSPVAKPVSTPHLQSTLPSSKEDTISAEALLPPSIPQYSLEELGNLSAAVVAASNSNSFGLMTDASRPTNSNASSSNNDKHSSNKRSLPHADDTGASNKRSISNGVRPSKVRVFHILKKHKDSRKPTSWRVPNITITKEEATEELQALLDVLREVQHDPAELRATLEELARTESDCSSFKRGGDLGFFGPKKMQPPFEDAAFTLNINELSGIVETSSGVHILLRVG